MSDVARMLAEEAEYAEEHKDAEPGPDTKISRPNRRRSHVFSVRLSEEEMRQLNEAADRTGVAASTLARSLITQQLTAENRPPGGLELRNALAAIERFVEAWERKPAQAVKKTAHQSPSAKGREGR